LILPKSDCLVNPAFIFLLPTVNNEKNKRIIDIAESIGKKYETGIDNILLAFLTTHPAGIIPVLGTSKTERLTSAIANSGLRLEREEWFMLWAASAGNDVP